MNSIRRHRSPWLVAVFLVCSGLGIQAENLEKSVCGWREPPTFAAWRFLAENTGTASSPRKAARYSFTTSDRKVLRGYKLSSVGSEAAGAILFIQGNSSLVKTLADDLEPLARGFDVFALDFRGYGESEGLSRIGALLSDYKEIAAYLRESYPRVFIYGISLGGVIASNLLDSHVGDATVIDSSPAIAAGCPESINPLSHIPDSSCKQLLLIAGGRDRVVKFAEVKPLLDKAAACGATPIVEPGWTHPFMGPPEESSRRLAAVLAFFKRSVR